MLMEKQNKTLPLGDVPNKHLGRRAGCFGDLVTSLNPTAGGGWECGVEEGLSMVPTNHARAGRRGPSPHEEAHGPVDDEPWNASRVYVFPGWVGQGDLGPRTDALGASARPCTLWRPACHPRGPWGGHREAHAHLRSRPGGARGAPAWHVQIPRRRGAPSASVFSLLSRHPVPDKGRSGPRRPSGPRGAATPGR